MNTIKRDGSDDLLYNKRKLYRRTNSHIRNNQIDLGVLNLTGMEKKISIFTKTPDFYIFQGIRGLITFIKEGSVLFNDALNTFSLQLYSVRHMVKDHSDSEKGNPLPPHELLFPISSKGSFICTIPQTG